MNKKQFISLILALVLILSLFCGCSTTEEPNPNLPDENPASEEPVKLKVVGAWEDVQALEVTAKAFNEKYPNCTVEYEFIQDYYANLEKRLQSGTDPIDLFFTVNIQSDSALLPYSLDLYSVEGLDLSQTFEGLIHNFEFRDTEDNSKQLYSIPLGAEMRGMFVNKTLLKSLGIEEAPQKLSEFNEDCKILSENGYIPLHGNPGLFAQQLMYPYVCNIIANSGDYDSVYSSINSREAGISELFREPMSVLYSFVENKYYNYKYVENELGIFTDTTNEAYARYFLNIGGEEGAYEKTDDKGTIAFMPGPISLTSTIEQIKSDYHSEIEYEFVLSPISEEGGFSYLSPAHGIAANKNSENLEWIIKFLNFLYEPKNNELFAENFHIVPNTKNALSIISEKFEIPEDHISEVGQITFDYGFYNAVVDSLVDVAKANNPKYMDKDGTELYPLEHYMESLEQRLVSGE